MAMDMIGMGAIMLGVGREKMAAKEADLLCTSSYSQKHCVPNIPCILTFSEETKAEANPMGLNSLRSPQ